MKITNETELMYNQKGSLVTVPDKQFEALQTVEGRSLLFSIGLDNILFCTREVPGDTHGWVRVDLSSSLSASCYGGAPVVAKTFDIAQDLTYTNSVDIALVVTVGGIDYLHLVTGFDNTFDNWTSNAPLFDETSQFKFDYPGDTLSTYQAMPVNEVQIVDSNDGNGMQYIIVDLVNASQTLSRFYIDTTKQHGYAWLPHNLQATLVPGKVTSFIGCGPKDGPNGPAFNVGGVYVLGTVNSQGQLFYTPTCNYLHPEEHAESTIFNLPAGYNSEYMAMGLSSPAAAAPYTDLFFASNGTLYFLANADQIDTETTNPTPQPIYSHDLFKNIQTMQVKNWNDNIVIWGQSLSTDGSGTSQLFIMEGVAGHETDGAAAGVNGTAWSVPIPLLLNVENSSAYVNNNYSLDSSLDSENGNAYGSCSVLFAHLGDDTGRSTNDYPAPAGGSLVQLFQDPVTGAWQQRFILTVPNTYLEMHETESYTTHITVTDNNNISQPGITAYIWSSSPTSVYVNNVYTTLEFDSPYKATADVLGIINIMQPVDSIGGISYYVAVQDPDTASPTYQQWTTEALNPLTVINANLAKQVPDGDNNHCGGTVPDEQGNPTNLAGSSSATDQLKTSQSIYAFGQHKSDVNADGLTADQGTWPDPATAIAALQSVQVGALSAATISRHGRIQRTKKFAKPARQAKHLRFNTATDKIWGTTFGENGKHYQGHEAMKEMGLVVNADGTLALQLSNGNLVGSSSWFESTAGHIWKWLKSAINELESVIVITLDAVGLHCVVTIAGEVYHFVIKCANDIANAVHTALNAIESAFKKLISWIGSLFAWGDIKRTHQVLKQMFTTYANNCINNISTIQDQLNYAAEQAVANINSWAGLPDSTFPTDSYSSQNANVDQSKGQNSPSSNWGHTQSGNNASSGTSSSAVGEIGDLLEDFFTAVVVEADIIIQAIDQIKEIISNITSQPLETTIKQIVAVVADTVIESSVNVTDTLLTAAGQLLTDLIETTLGAPIYIPVLSSLYKTFIGDELTILDLACLVTAIPVNIIYKIANNMQAPFPDNSSTTALISATNFNDFISAAANIQLPAVSASASNVSASAISLGSTASDDWEKFVGGVKAHWTLIGNACALAGSIGVSIFGVAKTLKSDNYWLASAYTAFYLPYIGPDIIAAITSAGNPGKFWYNYFNVGMAATAFLKAGIDIYCVSEYRSMNPAAAAAVTAAPKKALAGGLGAGEDDDPIDVPPGPPAEVPAMGEDVEAKPGWRKPFTKDDGSSTGKTWTDISPFVDAALNLIWYAPVIVAFVEAKNHNWADPYGSYKSNVLQCTGNCMFNFGGVIAPFPSFAPSPFKEIAMGVQVVMNLGYGSMSLASTWE
ncbi:hypothetical protein [Flavitalea sp.]|nr:hypothetical protein [Flavitalea sp.]